MRCCYNLHHFFFLVQVLEKKHAEPCEYRLCKWCIGNRCQEFDLSFVLRAAARSDLAECRMGHFVYWGSPDNQKTGQISIWRVRITIQSVFQQLSSFGDGDLWGPFWYYMLAITWWVWIVYIHFYPPPNEGIQAELDPIVSAQHVHRTSTNLGRMGAYTHKTYYGIVDDRLMLWNY